MKLKFVVAAAFALVACGQSPPAPKAEGGLPPASGPTPAEIAAKVAALPAPYNGGSYEHGERLFALCRSCHTVAADGANRVGPRLHGVFGRPAGSVADYASYSAALKASGIVWSPSRIDLWIADPRTVVPGNNMVFPGVRDAQDRRDLIAFLAVQSQ